MTENAEVLSLLEAMIKSGVNAKKLRMSRLNNYMLYINPLSFFIRPI